MRYVIGAVLVVGLIIAGMLLLPERWGQDSEFFGNEATAPQAAFVDLPPPEVPDYETVVTDEALAQELAAEAEDYLAEVSQTQAVAGSPQAQEQPLLLSAESDLAWAGQSGSVRQLLAKYGLPLQKNALYYAHRVQHGDDQGVWGVVQKGLMQRFAEGIAARRGQNLSTYRVLIPQTADERNADGTSSFLGRVIWHKTQTAQVINTQQGVARRAAELVIPQQDLVIVAFERQELVAIYQHFSVAATR